MAPVRLTEAEGHLVVVEQIYIHTIPGQAHEWVLMPGDVVLGVNGIDINKKVTDMLQYISYPNEEKALFTLNDYLILRQTSSAEPMILDILRDDAVIMIEVQTVNRQQHTMRFFHGLTCWHMNG